jgi:hypothetical protein
MSNYRILFLALGLLFICPNCSLQPTEVTREQARQLVLAVLQSQGFDVKSPNLVVEDWPDAPDIPGFYLLGAHTIAPDMNLSAGSFAVGRRTAEVWNWTHCWRFSRAKNVRNLQKKLRKEIGVTDSEYQKLAAKRPFCFSIPFVEK